MAISEATVSATTPSSVSLTVEAAASQVAKKTVVCSSSSNTKIAIVKKKKQQQQKATKPESTSSQPVTIHPEAGTPLCRYTARCRCGGITGIVGTGKGTRKWKTHVRTRRHIQWETSYLAQQAAATASESSSSEEASDESSSSSPTSSEPVSDFGKPMVVDLTED